MSDTSDTSGDNGGQGESADRAEQSGEQTGEQSVGSVGEEAVKLLQALQGWAQESSGDYAQAAASAAEGAASSLHRVNEHLATDSAECRYCPVCQVISAVRHTSPEVRQHLSSAATSLLHAAAGVLATAVPEQDRRAGSPGVQRIDLDDDRPDGSDGPDRPDGVDRADADDEWEDD